jgi:hypothetical protein
VLHAADGVGDAFGGDGPFEQELADVFDDAE